MPFRIAATKRGSIRSAPGGAINTLRGLTRSSDSTREGLGMEPTRTYSATLPRRLWRNLAKDSPRGCWEWRGATNANGYGIIYSYKTATGRHVCSLTHRVAWSLLHGDIPAGMYICHKCDNPLCCNPLHLFLGTPVQNSQDMISKGRRGESVSAVHARKTHCVKRHPFTPENTYVSPKTGWRLCRTCISARKKEYESRPEVIERRRQKQRDRRRRKRERLPEDSP